MSASSSRVFAATSLYLFLACAGKMKDPTKIAATMLFGNRMSVRSYLYTDPSGKAEPYCNILTT
jgi:hypothetical protein